MKKSSLLLTLFCFAAMSQAQAGPGWNAWCDHAGQDVKGQRGPNPSTVTVVPAGSATYTGSTVALVSDSSSGSLVRSTSTGTITMDVTFSGTGTTTQSGSITSLTGSGATLGDLAFTGSGSGSKFSGTVTSAAYTTGTGAINGDLSKPVVSGTTVSAPLSVTGGWNFAASSTLSAKGSYAATR